MNLRKKAVILLAVLALALLIIGCSTSTQPEKLASSNNQDKETSSNSESTANTKTTETKEEFKLEYCGDAVKSASIKVKSSQSKVDKKQADITELKAKPSDPDTDKELQIEEKNLKELQDELSEANSYLADINSKCTKLAKSKDSGICAEFLADLEQDISDTTANIEKKKLDINDYQNIETKSPAAQKAVKEEIDEAQKRIRSYEITLTNLNKKKAELEDYC